MNFRQLFQTIGLVGVTFAIAPAVSSAEDNALIYVDQGKNWTDAARQDFYSRDQGSRLIPLPWITALKQANGEPFLADGLARYGYLPNEASSPPGLAVGFVVAGDGKEQTLGLTCSACHTRQIEVVGKSYRIDGGPAIADLQSFWADLDKAVNSVLSDSGAFANFAKDVLGPSPSPDEEKALREKLQAWFEAHHAITEHGLPKDKPWGPARIDAVGMILNRVTGLDIGPPPSYIIENNIKPADAPVRPPFLWNASRQDETQWPGFADNGDKILALSRNLGEVYGVFAIAHPKKDASHLLGIDYLNANTANFTGLDALEGLIEKIAPPKWPWPVDAKLAARGKEIYEWPTDQGGCAECHGIRPGEPRLLNPNTWATPLWDVGTDSREYAGLTRTVQTGVLEGAEIPFIAPPLKHDDSAVAVLGVTVRGALLQHFIPITVSPIERRKLAVVQKLLGDRIQELKGAFKMEVANATPSVKYESRVLEGIWAAAPYLHNGSVPTLAELLKPAAERVSAFKVGPAYDVVNVGLATDQTKFNYTLKTTDCSDRNSGDSRCGHEYGTKLPPDDKKALLEYLKTL